MTDTNSPTGNLPTHPVVGWSFYSAAQTAIVLQLHTVQSEDDLRAVMRGTRAPDHFNALLTPTQCLELAERLQAHAEAILGQRTPPRSRQS
jgi:hypothetical protein